MPLSGYREDIQFSDSNGTGLLRDLDLVGTGGINDAITPIAGEGLVIDGR